MRLTNRKTYSDLKNNAERLQAKGMEVSISDLMYIKLAEYENAEEDADVQRGKWEEVTDYGGWGDTHYRCSVCGEEWYLEDGKPKDNNMNFCPRCGAKMIKDGNTE